MFQKYTLGFIYAFTAGFILTASATAETIVYYAPHADVPVITFDSENPGQFASPKTPPHSTYNNGTRGSITWAVTYNDVVGNTNLGFDDPGLGATRQANLLAVLEYIDTVLGSTTPATIEVLVNTSQTDGSGALASAGTLYFTSVGISPGFAATHIQTGVDPSGGNVDINVTVDFGWTWNSDHTQSPSGGEVDLYSVLVHEITHGLGVASLTNASGQSVLSGTNPGKFSTMNLLMNLGTGGASPLFDNSGQFIGTAPGDLISNNVYANATNATTTLGSNPKIYAPGTFSQGSSLSHWDASNPGVMNPSIGAGVEKREFADFEVAFFKDLGYPNAAAPSTTPTLTLSQGQYQYFEGDGNATISVTLNPASSAGSVSVNYATASGGSNPATPGVDYTNVSNTLTWVMGESGTKTFDIPLLTDGPVEDHETVLITLSSPTGDGVLGSPSSGTLIIVDAANMPISNLPIILLLLSIMLTSGLIIRKTIKS